MKRKLNDKGPLSEYYELSDWTIAEDKMTVSLQFKWVDKWTNANYKGSVAIQMTAFNEIAGKVVLCWHQQWRC